jgi:anti-sigma regulatory factor (Ser/Thr protein kinase)
VTGILGVLERGAASPTGAGYVSATADGSLDDRTQLTFGDSSCLRPLRRTIRAMLPDADEETLVDAELVATELVANALEHAEGPRSVEITRQTITVVDGSPDAQLTIGTSRLGDHRGRGLTILQATSLWNVTRTATSKAVAAVLTVRTA